MSCISLYKCHCNTTSEHGHPEPTRTQHSRSGRPARASGCVFADCPIRQLSPRIQSRRARTTVRHVKVSSQQNILRPLPPGTLCCHHTTHAPANTQDTLQAPCTGSVHSYMLEPPRCVLLVLCTSVCARPLRPRRRSSEPVLIPPSAMHRHHRHFAGIKVTARR